MSRVWYNQLLCAILNSSCWKLKAQNEKNPFTHKIHSSLSRSVFMPTPFEDLDPFQAAAHLLPFILVFVYRSSLFVHRSRRTIMISVSANFRTMSRTINCSSVGAKFIYLLLIFFLQNHCIFYHGYETLRFAGLFDLQISIHFVQHAPDCIFEIWVSQ